MEGPVRLGVLGQIPGPVDLVGDEDWDRVFTLNVDAMFAICRAAVPAMKRAARGRIVNISSGAGLKASIHPVQAYGAAKHAVVGMTRLLAAERRRWGTRGGRRVSKHPKAARPTISCRRPGTARPRRP